MAGIVTGGQTLTPNRNVNAPAGNGGDLWGANGGGVTAMNGSKPLAATLSDGETATNYQPGTTRRSIKQQISNAALSGQTLDSNIAAGGSTQG